MHCVCDCHFEAAKWILRDIKKTTDLENVAEKAIKNYFMSLKILT